MSPNPVQMTASQPPNPSTPASTPLGNNELTGDDFMTLLVAQLKNQDPTSPMDPTQFVTQLVQFNSLEQLIGMKQDLDTLSSASPGAPASSSPNTPSSPATPTQNS